MTILITHPSLSGLGGVTQYYKALLPHLGDDGSWPFFFYEVGHLKGSRFAHPLLDQWGLWKILSKGGIDLVQVNPSLDLKSFLRDGLFIWLAKRKRLPVLVFFHGWDFAFEPQVRSRWWWFAQRTYLKADGFVVLSSRVKVGLRGWGVGAPIYKETTAVDEQLIRDFSLEEKLEQWRRSERLKILFLGRVAGHKGIFETLGAVKSLLDRGHDVSLSIAGDGPAVQDVQDFIRRHGMDDRVFLLGYVTGDAKRRILNDHHAYCLPSHYEGMPLSVLEAMALAMPVVTCPVGGLADFFEDGKMGFFVEDRRPEGIADRLEYFLADKERLIAMASYNHRYAMEHFRASVVAQRLKRICKDILNGRKQPEEWAEPCVPSPGAEQI